MERETGAAIVTGASQGIGRSVALALAARGVAVALVSRNEEALAAVGDEVARAGGRATVVPGDVSKAGDVEAIVAASVEELGAVDVLVNNAGLVERAPIPELSEEAWDRVVDVNLKGVFLASRAVLPAMLERGRGRIVNVSSISGRLGTPELSAYCASKWGVNGFTKASAEEVHERGVQVFAVCPGSVNTPMLAKGLPGAVPAMEPEHVADVVVYLALDAPDAMTGALVDVFG